MKALIKNNAVAQYPYSFTQLRRDNPSVSYPGDPSNAKLEEWGVFDVHPSPPPNRDPITQKAEEQTPVLIEGVWTQQWSVVDLPPDEVEANERQEERRKEQKAVQRASDIAARKVADDVLETLPDEDVETLTFLYPKWSGEGVALEIDDLVRHDSILYKVAQAHTTQADWTPPDTPALFTRFRDPAAGPQPWEQLIPPETYNTGDRVTHPNPNDGGAVWVYESTIDANTTEPGQDGTLDRWWTPIEVAA